MTSDDLYGADRGASRDSLHPTGPVRRTCTSASTAASASKPARPILRRGLETESPRGRIALMKAVNEGRIGITPNVYRHWDSVHPVPRVRGGVSVGRSVRQSHRSDDERCRTAPEERALLARCSGELRPELNHTQAGSSRTRGEVCYGCTNGAECRSAIRKTKILSTLAPGLAELETSSPTVSKQRFRARGQVYPAQGEVRARVSHPVGVRDATDARVRRWTPRCACLPGNGCEVEVTESQGCCGAIHSHVGDLDRARELARKNIDAFEARGRPRSRRRLRRLRREDEGVRHHLLENDPGYAEQSGEDSARRSRISTSTSSTCLSPHPRQDSTGA